LDVQDILENFEDFSINDNTRKVKVEEGFISCHSRCWNAKPSDTLSQSYFKLVKKQPSNLDQPSQSNENMGINVHSYNEILIAEKLEQSGVSIPDSINISEGLKPNKQMPLRDKFNEKEN